MIGQYLPQTNESATVPKTFQFSELNKAPPQRCPFKPDLRGYGHVRSASHTILRSTDHGFHQRRFSPTAYGQDSRISSACEVITSYITAHELCSPSFSPFRRPVLLDLELMSSPSVTGRQSNKGHDQSTRRRSE